MLEYKTIRVIKEHDFNELVTNTYGLPYKLQQQNGIMERQYFEIYIDSEEVIEGDETEYDDIHESIPLEINGPERLVRFGTWVNSNPTDIMKEAGWTKEYEIRLFYHRNFYPPLDMLLGDLYKKGLLEEGTFYINIDW